MERSADRHSPFVPRIALIPLAAFFPMAERRQGIAFIPRQLVLNDNQGIHARILGDYFSVR
jgi:hypothetical protein